MCMFDCKLCRDMMFGRQVMQEMKGLKDIVHGYRAHVWNIMKPLIDGERLQVICVISNLDMIAELDSCMELLWVFAELIILGILGCSRNVHVSRGVHFHASSIRLGQSLLDVKKISVMGGLPRAKWGNKMGCRFEGVFLEGHVIVWCTGMHLNTQCRRFFILGTLRLLDLSFTRSYYKTKTATWIVNQEEVIRIRADTSMISLNSNFKVTRSIHLFIRFPRTRSERRSCRELSRICAWSGSLSGSSDHFEATCEAGSKYVSITSTDCCHLVSFAYLECYWKTTPSHLFIVTEPDDLDAQVTTNLVDSIRHEMMKALAVNDSTLH